MEQFNVCEKCNGTGNNENEHFVLLRPCIDCSGSGKIEWIKNITKQKNSKELYDNEIKYSIKNIELLTRLLRQEYLIVGHMVRIDIHLIEKYTNVGITMKEIKIPF